MNSHNEIKELVGADKNTLNYCRELVWLNHLYEKKLISKDEMLMIKANISKFYGVGNTLFLD